VKCGRRFAGPQAVVAAPVAPAQAPSVESVGQVELFGPEATVADQPAGPKIIPIAPPAVPTLASARTEAAPAKRVARNVTRNSARSKATGAKQSKQEQHAFQFEGVVVTTMPAIAKDEIATSAPVATVTHRALASLVDNIMIALGVGLFIGIFFISGGEGTLGIHAIAWLLAVTVGVAIFYRLLWCFANRETPGMQSLGLRLVDFDGHAPSPSQRLRREYGRFLSIAAATLGLVWAMIDEEALTWHDHISKTFPTYLQVPCP